MNIQYKLLEMIFKYLGTNEFFDINVPNKRDVDYSDKNDVLRGNETSDVLMNSPRKLLEWYDGQINESMFKDKTILDLGSGFGGRAIYYAQNCKECIGIDVDTQGIKESRKYAQYIGQKNVRFDYGAGEELPYESNYFDIVFSFDVLEHVNDVEKVMEEVYRVLKPGGLFCSVFPPYYSTHGAHIKRTDFPWMNVFFSTKTTYQVLRNEYNDNYEIWTHKGKTLRTGINGTTIKDFNEIMSRSKYKIKFFELAPMLSKPTNRYKKIKNHFIRELLRAFSASLLKIKPLREYLTHRIVFIFEK